MAQQLLLDGAPLLSCSQYLTIHLPIAIGKLLIPHSSLLNPHSSLLIAHSSLLTPHSSLLNPHSSLFQRPLLNHAALCVFDTIHNNKCVGINFFNFCF